MNFVSTLHNKQNISKPPTKASTKSMNFGKQIRYKANVKGFQSPQLKESTRYHHNIQLDESEDLVSFSKLKMSKSPSLNTEDLSFRSKIVKFEDEEKYGESSQISNQAKLRKKNPSILKKASSNFSDNMSVNSANSDMGQIECLSPKNSLKDQGAACSNDKYVKQVKALKLENTKFTDRLFPPGSASLSFSKAKTAEFKEIKWMRIEQLYKGKKMVLYNHHSLSKCHFYFGPVPYGNNMTIAMNSLANSNRCLERIFEEQKVFGLCIYYLRINHDGIWKYVLVDDYIPVVKEGNIHVPAFMRVVENDYGEVQIWPLLLQKAVAKVYNSYEALFDDSAENILFDLTGFPCQHVNLQDPEQQFMFRNEVSHCQSVSLLSDPINRQFLNSYCYPIRQDGAITASTFFTLDLRMKLMDLNKYTNVLIDVSDLRRQFRYASLFSIRDNFYSLGCIIKQAKNTFTLRKFTVRERGLNCLISLIQKDKKYYNNNGYNYVWARIMVVAKDGAHGYRWIAGKYLQTKVISLSLTLEPGQYFVLVTGDWKNRVYEMTLNYQGSQQITFQRQSMEKHPQILTETCMDIAQRFGELRQLNTRLCSYRLVDQKNGFIIENINNEVFRNVVFYKEYQLKGQNYEILNKQQSEDGEENLIQIKIQPNSHFTFIAKLINGFDDKLLTNFRFE